MKPVPSLATALLLTLAACTAPTADRIDPAGSYPDARGGNVVRESRHDGRLSVATPLTRVDQEGKPFDPPHRLGWGGSYLVPTGYTLFDAEGRLVAEVPNHPPLVVSDERPSIVVLPPGRYLVRLHRPGPLPSPFWVTVDADRLTEVDPALLAAK